MVVDGDTLLQPGCLSRSLPFLQLLPDVGGITTDEDCVVESGPLLRAWHQLRFAQRHLLMSSMALSRRLLVLTGRMSIFRGSLATDPGFLKEMDLLGNLSANRGNGVATLIRRIRTLAAEAETQAA